MDFKENLYIADIIANNKRYMVVDYREELSF